MRYKRVGLNRNDLPVHVVKPTAAEKTVSFYESKYQETKTSVPNSALFFPFKPKLIKLCGSRWSRRFSSMKLFFFQQQITSLDIKTLTIYLFIYFCCSSSANEKRWDLSFRLWVQICNNKVCVHTFTSLTFLAPQSQTISVDTGDPLLSQVVSQTGHHSHPAD